MCLSLSLSFSQDTDTLTMAKVPRKYNDAKGCCPFNPYQRNTAISVGEIDNEPIVAELVDCLGDNATWQFPRRHQHFPQKCCTLYFVLVTRIPQFWTCFSIDGELFTATTNDFLGKTPMVSRHLSKDGRPDVSQDTSVTLNGEWSSTNRAQ